MEDYRSKSCRDGGMMQMDKYNIGGEGKYEMGPTNMNGLRSYSTSYATTNDQHPSSNTNNMGKVVKFMKEKKSGTSTSSSSSKISWMSSFNDPELQRKKRVASYKVYSVEGKMKGSFKKSFRWIKDVVVYGWR